MITPTALAAILAKTTGTLTPWELRQVADALESVPQQSTTTSAAGAGEPRIDALLAPITGD